MANNIDVLNATGGTETVAATDHGANKTPHTILSTSAGVAITVGQQTMTNSLPVTLASNQSAVTIADGGGSITVDGTVAMSGTAAVTIVDGGAVTLGALADAVITTDTTGTVNSKLRGLIKWAYERMPASLGQKAMTASLPVVLASDQSAIPVTGTLTGAVTIADGADVTLGAKADVYASTDTGTFTLVALVKRILGIYLSNMDTNLTTITTSTNNIEGNSTDILSTTGDTADAAIITDTTGSVSGKLRGLIKWAYERMPAALGQATMANSLPVAIASNQSSLNVIISPSINSTTITAATIAATGAYATGDSIGTKLTFTNAMGGLDGRIKTVILNSLSGILFDAKVVFFDSDPTVSTFTDNAAVVVPGADLERIVGIAYFVQADFASFSSSASAYKEVDIVCDAKTAYGVIMAGTTAPDFGVGTNQVSISIGTVDY